MGCKTPNPEDEVFAHVHSTSRSRSCCTFFALLRLRLCLVRLLLQTAFASPCNKSIEDRSYSIHACIA